MKILKLSENQIEDIYTTYLIHDFHEAEVKSLSHIKSLFQKGNYLCFGLFDETNILFAYAFFCISKKSPWLFLDYYAVCPDYRSSGYGSVFLNFLKETCIDRQGILAEVEDPNFVEEQKEKDICIRRIEFYKRNHWFLSQIYSCVFGVSYQIMQLPFKARIEEEDIYYEVQNIYTEMFSADIYEKEVKLYAQYSSSDLQIKLRNYHPIDAKEMYQLFYDTVHSVSSKDYSKEQLDVWAAKQIDLEKWSYSFLKHNTIVAVQNHKIIGFGNISDTGYLDHLYVHKDFQRQKIAAFICNLLEKYAYRNNCSSVSVHASITAKPFFLSRGYQLIKEQQVKRQEHFLTNFILEKTL